MKFDFSLADHPLQYKLPFGIFSPMENSPFALKKIAFLNLKVFEKLSAPRKYSLWTNLLPNDYVLMRVLVLVGTKFKNQEKVGRASKVEADIP